MSTTEKLIQELHPLAQQALEGREIEKLPQWLDPQFSEAFHDPYEFRQMKEFVDRLHDAVSENERVVVFSDFDTDGIPAAVQMHDLFCELGFENFEVYIPARDVEGFGLHVNQVKQFAERETDLLITIDCGIRSNAAVEEAKSAGMDVAILDHHVAGEAKPPADIIINPALEDETYPFKSLCGGGVVFKCLQAVSQDERFDLPENFVKGQLGMAAIATVSDMVPLVGENRAIARFGLQILRQTTRPGLRELTELGRIQRRELTAIDIGFTIGSHINAASRLDQPMVAFHTLSTRNREDGKRYAKELNKLYRERKRRTKKLKKSVKEAVGNPAEAAVIAVGSSEWKPAMLGPVAHGLTDNYGVPAFLWGEANGRLKGSARAARHNVVGMMEAVEAKYFKQFGGHEFAGGFELNPETANEFPDALAEVADGQVVEGAGDELPQVTATLADISWGLYASLEKLAPFGVGNAAPLFRVTGVTVTDKRLFGAGDEHVEVTVANEDNERKAICFFASKQMREVPVGATVALSGALEKSTFGFRRELRFRMEELSIVDSN